MKKRMVLLLVICTLTVIAGCGIKYNPDISEHAVDTRMSKLLEKDNDADARGEKSSAEDVPVVSVSID